MNHRTLKKERVERTQGRPRAPARLAESRPRTLRRTEPVRSALVRLAPLKSVSMNLDSRRSAPDRSAPASEVPLKSPPKMRAPCRSAAASEEKLKSARDRSAPCK